MHDVRDHRRYAMAGRIVWVLVGIFGVLRFFSTASRVVVPSEALQDVLLDDTRREAFIGSLSQVKDDRAIVTTILDPNFIPDKDITFHLFTRENPDESYILRMNDTENLKKSPLKSETTTKFIVHGWTDSVNSYWVKDMRKNYLDAGDYNVICVDWYSGAFKEYFVAARLTRQLGEYVGDFLEYLTSQGNVGFDNLHLLGHSLGAHIAGYAGATTAGRVGRITGLDPARPAFEAPVFKGQKDRLDPSDALFVDVIHTCAGTAGFVRAVGHVDFYPNGGSFRQPGCSVLVSQYCSHGRSYQFMTESIAGGTDFVATKCDSWSNYKAGKCDATVTATMGESVDPATRGKYFLETNSETPFAKGMATVSSSSVDP